MISVNYFVRQSFFVFRFRYINKWIYLIHESFFKLNGMKIGNGTSLPKVKITWPHQVQLGSNCIVEHGVYFHYDGIYSEGPSICLGNNVFIGNYTEFNIAEKISIGDNCLIAAGCRFIDHNHGIALGILIREQLAPKQKIILEKDVWLGCNVVVLKGVCIGEGAVVGAGSVVNKSIPRYEIWGGVPARFIKKRI
jgi:acetyltransferase-like isoleucine patch superfamily enzyme